MTTIYAKPVSNKNINTRSLRALYEHFYEGLKSMHAMELGEEDLAVMYPAVWEPDPPQNAQ